MEEGMKEAPSCLPGDVQEFHTSLLATKQEPGACSCTQTLEGKTGADTHRCEGLSSCHRAVLPSADRNLLQSYARGQQLQSLQQASCAGLDALVYMRARYGPSGFA